jgi:hypothetical protein
MSDKEHRPPPGGTRGTHPPGWAAGGPSTSAGGAGFWGALRTLGSQIKDQTPGALQKFNNHTREVWLDPLKQISKDISSDVKDAFKPGGGAGDAHAQLKAMAAEKRRLKDLKDGAGGGSLGNGNGNLSAAVARGSSGVGSGGVGGGGVGSASKPGGSGGGGASSSGEPGANQGQANQGHASRANQGQAGKQLDNIFDTIFGDGDEGDDDGGGVLHGGLNEVRPRRRCPLRHRHAFCTLVS